MSIRVSEFLENSFTFSSNAGPRLTSRYLTNLLKLFTYSNTFFRTDGFDVGYIVHNSQMSIISYEIVIATSFVCQFFSQSSHSNTSFLVGS